MSKNEYNYNAESKMFEKMAIDYEKSRQSFLKLSSLHIAAGIPSEDFRDICDIIERGKEKPEYYDTNLPTIYSNISDTEMILEYQKEYPHLFEVSKYPSPGIIYCGWQLSWLGRALFKEYPYKIDIDTHNGKLQTYIDCTFQSTTNGIPIYIFTGVTYEIIRHDLFNATKLFVSGIEENWTEDLDSTNMPTGPKFQLDTGQEIIEGKTYNVDFSINPTNEIYEPYGEMYIDNIFFGLDGVIQMF